MIRAATFAIVILSANVLRSAEPAQERCAPASRGLGTADRASIRAAYEASRHAVVPDAHPGQWTASNPGQRWITTFDGRGATITPDEGDWSWGLELERFGFAGCEAAVDRPLGTRVEGSRLTYDWGHGVEEWYVNDRRGLEHGFTIRERSPAASRGDARDDSSFSVQLGVRGGLAGAVDPDGRGARFATVIDYAGLTVIDADGRELVARMETTPGRVRIVFDDRDARYPITIDPVAQQAYLKASNTGAHDNFGTSIALSGDTCVVGARGENSATTGINGNQGDNSAPAAGAAYVFVRNQGVWTQQAYLKASNTNALDEFGGAVALDGDTCVIGAAGESSAATGVNGNQADNTASNAGAAYVFVRNGTTWTQQAYLKASNPINFDRFGVSVAIEGDTCIVGATGEDSAATGVDGNQADNSASAAGAAYVFVRNGTTWTQQAYLKASNTQSTDEFGFPVRVWGNTCVVGATAEDSRAAGVGGNQADESEPQAGAAYVFVRSGSTWSQQAYLKASNPDTFDRFGSALAIEGDTCVVGAVFEDSGATGVNGNQADESANGSGAAYVFVRSGSTWAQQAYLKASNTGLDDRFGAVAALSGELCVIGAWGERSAATGIGGNQSDDSAIAAGAAYVFRRNGVTWSQQAYLKASNTNANDAFGNSVALSGTTCIVGASQEDSGAIGVNGNQTDDGLENSGAVYAFDLTAWHDLGFGLSGVNGIPTLVGSGTMQPGSSGSLVLSYAAPSAPAAILVALSSTPVAAYCGTIVPIPAVYAFGYVTDASGGRVISWSTFPSDLVGQSLYFQWLIADTGAKCTLAMSNAVRGDVP